MGNSRFLPLLRHWVVRQCWSRSAAVGDLGDRDGVAIVGQGLDEPSAVRRNPTRLRHALIQGRVAKPNGQQDESSRGSMTNWQPGQLLNRRTADVSVGGMRPVAASADSLSNQPSDACVPRSPSKG